MTAAVFLRIASIISLVFTVGHTLGGRQEWSPMGDNEVLKAMTTVRFDTMGANRSYLDFFMGFGWSISVAMLLQSVLLWRLASLARADPARVRPMVAAFAVATVVSGIIAWRFIFPLPALFSGALAISLVAAYVVFVVSPARHRLRYDASRGASVVRRPCSWLQEGLDHRQSRIAGVSSP